MISIIEKSVKSVYDLLCFGKHKITIDGLESRNLFSSYRCRLVIHCTHSSFFGKIFFEDFVDLFHFLQCLNLLFPDTIVSLYFFKK